MSGAQRVSYNYAVIRVVPHVHLGVFCNVGVVVHARTADFLGIRLLSGPDVLCERVPDVDSELLARYLRACEAICVGGLTAGPVALAPPSERFHWLTAPRSDVIQSSPVHEGICADPAEALSELFEVFVGTPARGSLLNRE